MGRPKTTSDDAKPETKKPPPQPLADDEFFEDGDFVTPKQDRHGDDDEPL